MPGLNIGIGGGRALGSSPGISSAAGATIAQTAYGRGSTEPQGQGIETHEVFLAAEAASLAFIVAVYWAGNPATRTSMRAFGLMFVPAVVVWGGVGIWSRHRLLLGKKHGFLHGTALVAKSVTP